MWFTPVAEVDLCGHATLAAAYVIFNYLDFDADTINFESKSGLLTVVQEEDLLVMGFPSQPPVTCPMPTEIISAFKLRPIECFKSKDYIVVFEKEEDVLLVEPDYSELVKLDLRGVAITAKSNNCDFVARFFGPKVGVNEDPVTGSAYTQLVPYWSKRLGVTKLHAKQLSKRGGELYCEIVEDRVKIAGRAVKFLVGEIEV
jgi:PhzF family phenazine biosynthesis protein